MKNNTFFLFYKNAVKDFTEIPTCIIIIIIIISFTCTYLPPKANTVQFIAL